MVQVIGTSARRKATPDTNEFDSHRTSTGVPSNSGRRLKGKPVTSGPVVVLVALFCSSCVLYHSDLFHTTTSRGALNMEEMTRIASTPGHPRRYLLSSIPSGLADDMADNDLEFACFDSSSQTCVGDNFPEELIASNCHAVGYCLADTDTAQTRSWFITKNSDTSVTVSTYTGDRTCSTLTQAFTFTEGQCQATASTWDGRLSQKFVGVTSTKPWVQGLTAMSSKYTMVFFEKGACDGRPVRYHFTQPNECGDVLDAVTREYKLTLDADGYTLDQYTDSTCTTQSSSKNWPSFDCYEADGAFTMVGDSATGAALGTTVTVLAATAIGGAIATSVATSAAGGAAGGSVGGSAGGSSPAGPIVELIHVMQLLSVTQSMGFVSNGGVRGMTENLAWANLYFEPPFSVDNQLVGTARRLMANANLASPASAGTSSQFVGNLFWFVIIFIALILTHLVVILVVWLINKAVAAIKKKPSAPLPGWVRMPKWEFLYLVIAFPGLALSSAQAIRSFDLRVSFVAVIVLLTLPLCPIALFMVIWRGTRAGGPVFYKKLADKSVILKPRQVISAAKVSVKSKKFCYDKVWETFYELSPLYGKWSTANDEGASWLDTWDFAVADWSRIARFHVATDLFLKWVRAIVLGMCVGFLGASYITWLYVFGQSLSEYGSRLFVRLKNKKVSQTLGTTSWFFVSGMFGSSVFLTTNNGFSIGGVEQAQLDLVIMCFAFFAVMCKIAEVALAPLGLVWSIFSFIASSVYAIILGSKSKRRKASVAAPGEGAEDNLEKGEVEDNGRHAAPPVVRAPPAKTSGMFSFLPCFGGGDAAPEHSQVVASNSESIEMGEIWSGRPQQVQ